MDALRRRLILSPEELRPLLLGVPLVALAGAAFALSAYEVSPLAVPALMIAIAFMAVTFLRPAMGVAGALLATPLELFHFRFLTGGLSPTEGALVVVAGAWVYRFLMQPDTVVKPSPRDIPILVLLGAVAVGLATATEPASVLRVLVLWTLFYFVYLQCQSFTSGEIRMVLAALAIGAGTLGAIGTVSYLRSGNIGLLAGGETTRERAVGTFVNPNAYASLMALALLPGLALAIARLRQNVWFLLPLLAALGGLLFSLSRGGILGFLIGLLVLLAWARARWLAVGVGGLFVLLTLANVNPLGGSDQLAIVGERLSTLRTPESLTTERPRIWSTAVDVTIEHPFFGVGVNQFEFESGRRGLVERGFPLENAHSIPLSLAAETGLIGLAAFLAFLGQLGARAGRALGALRASLGYALALGLTAALVAFLIQGLTVVQLRTPVLTGVFFVLAGMLTALADRAPKGGQAAGRPADSSAAG